MKHKATSHSNKNHIELLRNTDAVAIRALSKKIKPDIRRLVGATRLTEQDTEELMNDAIVVTIAAIKSGRFQDMDYHPAAYAMGVVKKLIANLLRKKRLQTEELKNISKESDFNPETYLKNKERQLIVQKLLSQLGKSCRELLELKYFKYLKDKEIIAQKITAYTNIASLKSKRSQCLKKLATLARQAGITEIF